VNWDNFADVVAAIFLLAGSFLTLAAGVGILRFPDLLARMHAATKPQALGLILMVSAEALRVRSWSVFGLLLLVVIFQLFTAPVGAHMVGRAGARTDQMRKELLVMDELTADQQQADLERLRALEHNPEIEQELARKIEERIAAMREQEGKPPAK
jgi:multicomponent Na+:H+ antiporter subunit G